MRMVLTLALAGAAVLVTTGTVLAQSAPLSPPPRPMEIDRMTAAEQSSRFAAEELRRRNLTPEQAEALYGQERMELARRVAALIEEGKCVEARELAGEAGERQMALRVRRTCRPART